MKKEDNKTEYIDNEKFDKLLREKNINFLIGSGAANGMIPTLSLGGKNLSIEELITDLKMDDVHKKIVYMYYFYKIIEPLALGKNEFYQKIKEDDKKIFKELAMKRCRKSSISITKKEKSQIEIIEIKNTKVNDTNKTCLSEFIEKTEKNRKREVLKNYKEFTKLLYEFLINESNEQPKRINIFTTNYDLIFERVFDDFLFQNPLIYFNDGSRGFFKKFISNKNFYLNVTHSGYNDNYSRQLPTINLFKMHGSISWCLDSEEDEISKQSKTIYVRDIDFDDKNSLINKLKDDIKKFRKILKDLDQELCKIESKNIDDYISIIDRNINTKKNKKKINNFFENYKKLPIINPDKYKFSETVLEQHYYQLIRSFSYELEKKNTILIVFGFSFADEHIKDIFERSLLNPSLLVFIISYSKDSQKKMREYFDKYNNVKFLPDFNNIEKGNFNFLNELLGGTNER